MLFIMTANLPPSTLCGSVDGKIIELGDAGCWRGLRVTEVVEVSRYIGPEPDRAPNFDQPSEVFRLLGTMIEIDAAKNMLEFVFASSFTPFLYHCVGVCTSFLLLQLLIF